MVDKSNISSIDATPSEGVLTHLSALERRRFLFKSLGKGVGAGVALGVPLSGYASNDSGERKLGHRHRGQTSSELYHCSVSGMQSAIASRDLANTTLAAGYSPGFWGQLNQPHDSCVNSAETGQTPVWGPNMKQTFPAILSLWSWTTSVNVVLTYSSLPATLTLGMLMAKGDGDCQKADGSVLNFGQHSGSDDLGSDAKEEVHWMCGILNAAILYPAGRFPYDAETIIKVANNTPVYPSIDRAALYALLKSLEGTGGL